MYRSLFTGGLWSCGASAGLSYISPPLLLTGYNLETELMRRNISLKRYQVVQVNIVPQFALRNRMIEESAEEWRRSASRKDVYNHGKRKK